MPDTADTISNDTPKDEKPYPSSDLEPTSDEEIEERKNPLGYTMTEETEEELDNIEGAEGKVEAGK